MCRIEKVRETKRDGSLGSSFAAHAAAIVSLLIIVIASSTALAGKASRGKLPTPSNFRVTAKTAYTVTVAWDSTTVSGDYQYHLSGAYNVPPAVLPKTARSHTFTALHPGNEYWFFIYAKNAAGAVSGQATVTTRTLSDTSPPTTGPVVSVTEVGANYAALSWTPPQDDGPHFTYEVFVNGALRATTGRGITSTVVRFLRPNTTYSMTVRGIDEGNHRSPFSDPVSVTTTPANPNDTTPPTTPAHLQAYGTGDGSTETHITWAQSTDDFDRQENIRYDVYLNGVLQEVRFGSGGPTIIYSEFGENVIEVFASDTAGNTSPPAKVTIFF